MADNPVDTMPRSEASNKTKKSTKTKTAGRGKTEVCSVRLLDGTVFEVALEKKADGQALLEKVCTYINIAERDYFGITFRDSQDTKFWLAADKKINKQLGNQPWVFNFEVKFYPPDPSTLQEDITRYQLCLQIRHDILSGKLPCSFITLALLGSYTVQSELGDYDPSEHGPDAEYIRNFHFAPKETPDLLAKIAELHRQHKGQSPSEAELNFLDNAKKLAMYGVDLHAAKDSEGVDINVGVCASGVLIYRDRLRMNRFAWPKILKISYKRNNFYVKVRPGEFEKFESTVGFKLANHRLAKRLWRTAVEHHTFFRLKEAEREKKGPVFFPRFNSRFRYSGKTQYQTKQHTAAIDRPAPLFERAASKRGIPGSRQSDGAGYGTRPGEDGDEGHGSDFDQEGVDEDGKAWYRDASGKKVYKTTTTTTQVTRYIIEGETEEELRQKEAEEEARRRAEQEELLRQQEERRLEEERAKQSALDSVDAAARSMPVDEAYQGQGIADEHMEKRVAGDGLMAEDIDFDKELRLAILSVTGMSDDLAVEKIEMRAAQES